MESNEQDLSEWMDEHVENRDAGAPPGKLGPTGFQLLELFQNEPRAAAEMANLFWQVYVHSPAFARDMRDLEVAPQNVRRHEFLVVAHGTDRYSLLLSDSSLKEGEVRSMQIRPSPREMQSGWPGAMHRLAVLSASANRPSPVFSLGMASGVRLVLEPLDAQPFAVVVSGPMQEELTDVPSPPAAVSAGSTAGAYVQDVLQQAGVTTAAHAIASGPNVMVDGQAGLVVSRDDLYTDSCFIHVPGMVPRRRSTNGTLQMAPRQHEPVTFEGAATTVGSARIVAWNYELPAVDPNLQQTVRTDLATARGDSGAALLDSKGYIVGFAHSRSKPSVVPTYSSWIWAEAVFQKHGLKGY